MQINNYIYTFNYDKTEAELCKLEARHIFNKKITNKLLFSGIKVEASISAFIKKRVDIISSSGNYTTLLDEIKKEGIDIEGFKVEYLVLDGDLTEHTDRQKKLRDIGYCFSGYPDYHNPTITYALCFYEDVWYFGVLIEKSTDWHKHKHKPRSYSSSISTNIAKSLVNIAAQANKEIKLLDACCGVGTIMLEACFSGYNIEGCDINWKICNDARNNLSHFNYTENVYNTDIKDLSRSYDAAIIDLPYNLTSHATDDDIIHIIASTAKLTNRLVIVSTSDITSLIGNTGFKVTDYCSVSKRGKTTFARRIWVCEKEIMIQR